MHGGWDVEPPRPAPVAERSTPRDRTMHAAWLTAAASIAAALIGLVVGNSGVVEVPYLAAAGSTVTLPVVTTTVTATQTQTATVTVTEQGGDGSSGGSAVGEVRLADPALDQPDLIAQKAMQSVTELGIDGQTFDFGWVTGVGYLADSPRDVMELNLKSQYTVFRARLGVQDTSQDGVGKIQIIADNDVIFSKTVRLQDSFDVKLPVDGVLRLKVRVFPETGANVLTYAVGNPVLA